MKLCYIAPIQSVSVAQTIYYGQKLVSFVEALYRASVPVLVIISMLSVLQALIKYKTNDITTAELVSTVKFNVIGLVILFLAPYFVYVLDALAVVMDSCLYR